MRRPLFFILALFVMLSLACNLPFRQTTPNLLIPTGTPTRTSGTKDSPTRPLDTVTPIPSLTPTVTTGAICVVTFFDENENQIWDGGEKVLGGVRVGLQQGTQEVMSAFSDAENAQSCFRGLSMGAFLITATPPEGYVPASPNPPLVRIETGDPINIEIGFQSVAQRRMGRIDQGEIAPAFGMAYDSVSANAIYLLSEGAVHRSLDKGIEWVQTGQTPPAKHVVASPAEPMLLWAGDGYDCFRGGPDTALFLSVDAGANWENVPAGQNLRPVAAHPTDSQQAWAVGCEGIFRTLDKGNNWELMDFDGWQIYSPNSIAIAPSDPKILYATGASEGGSGAVFFSSDGGVSWSTIVSGLEFWITSFSIHATNAAEVWFTTPAAVWHSLDNGETWEQSSTGLEKVAVGPDYVFEGRGLYTLGRSKSGILLLGSARGIFQSGDGGVNWSLLPDTPLDEAPVLQIFIDQDDWVWAMGDPGIYTFPLPTR